MLDAKLIPDGTVAPKDKPVVATLRLERFGRKKLCSTETKIRSGKLKGLVTERFRREVLDFRRKIPTRSADVEAKIRECWTTRGRVEGFKAAVVKTA